MIPFVRIGVLGETYSRLNLSEKAKIKQTFGKVK